MQQPPTDLLYGTIDLLVLKALSWKPQHGYAICDAIRLRTNGSLAVDDAALYKSLHRLEAQGFVESAWGVSENNRRAKYYEITIAGRRHLRARAAVWRDYARAVMLVIGDA
jgi:transcriptional regulator